MVVHFLAPKLRFLQWRNEWGCLFDGCCVVASAVEMVHCCTYVNLRSTGAKMEVCGGGSVRRWWWRCIFVLMNVVQMRCWPRCVKLQWLVRVSTLLARCYSQFASKCRFVNGTSAVVSAAVGCRCCGWRESWTMEATEDGGSKTMKVLLLWFLQVAWTRCHDVGSMGHGGDRRSDSLWSWLRSSARWRWWFHGEWSFAVVNIGFDGKEMNALLQLQARLSVNCMRMMVELRWLMQELECLSVLQLREVLVLLQLFQREWQLPRLTWWRLLGFPRLEARVEDDDVAPFDWFTCMCKD